MIKSNYYFNLSSHHHYLMCSVKALNNPEYVLVSTWKILSTIGKINATCS